MRLARDLELYREVWGQEAVAGRFQAFLESAPTVFERSHQVGHFTGSALLLTADLSRVALMHHKKLDRWLQFGGHADGCTELAQVAYREAQEEGGIQDLYFLPYEEALGLEEHPLPFDLDVHPIPARGEIPEHLHYDVRYLLYTHQPEALRRNEESHGLGWFTLEQARERTREESMLRMLRKLEGLRERLTCPAEVGPGASPLP